MIQSRMEPHWLAPWIRIRIQIKTEPGPNPQWGSTILIKNYLNAKNLTSSVRFLSWGLWLSVFLRLLEDSLSEASSALLTSCSSWLKELFPPAGPPPPSTWSGHQIIVYHQFQKCYISWDNFKVYRTYFLLKFSKYRFLFLAISHSSKSLNTSLSFKALWIRISIGNADPDLGARKLTKINK